MEENRKLEEEIVFLKTYVEVLKETVEDLKMAMYTITFTDDINIAQMIARQMLDDFNDADKFVKKTTLQKERERLEDN